MKSTVFDLAAALVGFDTVSANSNVAAAEWLADQLEGRGLRVRLHRYTDERGTAKANVVASVGPPRADGLLISGHLDTVPYADQPGWTRDPLHLTRDGDRVHGRGIADMKGFIAQCVDAVGQIAESSLTRPLVYVFTADEEIGCLGAARLAPELESLLDPIPLPRLAWIGEPTSGRIHHAHKSAVLFSIRVLGKSGHSGFPDAGVNAIVIAGRILAALETLGRQLRTGLARPDVFAEAPFSTLNVGTIRGGSAANVIPGECEIGILYRSLPGEDPLAIHGAIVRVLEGLDRRETPSSPEIARIEVSAPVVVPPMESPSTGPLVAALRESTGAGEPSGSLLAADGCRFEPLGVHTWICGPGEFDQAHQPDESLRMRDLDGGVALVERVVARICGADGPS